ncbi:MAG: hypothetical protein Q4Q25_01295 [Methanocorpusculum sp.]|nr:hypothetical protein [Methanocorpusculum sp.]
MSNELLKALNELNSEMYRTATTTEALDFADKLNDIIIKGIIEDRLGVEVWG